MRKKRVLFVYPSMIIGGSTSNLLSLLNCLEPEKYEISLVLKRNEGPLMEAIPKHVHVLQEAITDRGIFYKIKFVFLLLVTGYGYKAYTANRRIKKRGLSKQILADFVAKYLSQKQKGTYDYAIGGLEGWADRYVAYRVDAMVKCGWIHSVIDKIGASPEMEYEWMHKVDYIVSVSHNCNEQLKQVLPDVQEKAVYLENIMDTNVVRQRAKLLENQDHNYQMLAQYKGFKIVTVCRLSMHVKGLDRAVQAAAKLKEEGLKFLWVIIGDGEDRHKLEQMIRENDVIDCFVLLGKKSNPYPYMMLCDIMCMPSRWEGMPIVVTESKMLGIPPVVTRYLSVDEQIQDEVEGYVAENNDTAIIEKLRKCINNPQALSVIRKYLLQHEYGNREYIHTVEETLLHE